MDSPMRTNEANALAADIADMLRKIVYLPETSITPDTRLSDLDLDSLDLVEAGLELEAMVGRDLPHDVLTGAETIAALAAGFTGQAPRPRLALAA